MGVYIKDMEMPKSRGEYVFLLYVDSDGTATVEGAHSILKGEPFEAVPVPPHGRLIDADAMIRDIEKSIAPSWYIKERNADMVKFLSLEDTIIPAEEGE